MDKPVLVVKSSNALVPARELPCSFRPGDHTDILIRFGTTVTIPPPTPLFPGSPTLNANSPDSEFSKISTKELLSEMYQ